jgi:hypothetical protein
LSTLGSKNGLIVILPFSDNVGISTIVMFVLLIFVGFWWFICLTFEPRSGYNPTCLKHHLGDGTL